MSVINSNNIFIFFCFSYICFFFCFFFFFFFFSSSSSSSSSSFSFSLSFFFLFFLRFFFTSCLQNCIGAYERRSHARALSRTLVIGVVLEANESRNVPDLCSWAAAVTDLHPEAADAFDEALESPWSSEEFLEVISEVPKGLLTSLVVSGHPK